MSVRCSLLLPILLALPCSAAEVFDEHGITIMDPEVSRVDLPKPEPALPIIVDNRKRLFVDDWMIGEMDGLSRTLHPIEKHSANPVLSAEMSWEKPCVLLYGSVMFDPDREADRFRMWYLCFTPKYNEDYTKQLEKSGRIAYAISRDGLHWERPSLGLHEFEGSTDNNIVIPGPWGVASVHYDPLDPDPQRRYKAQVRYNGHRAYFSPDGIRWTDQGRMSLTAYDRSTIHWHPVERHWFASTKNWYTIPDGENQRGRGYSESDDFLNWGPVTYMCGTGKDSGEIVYGLEPFYYESLFLGLWDRYQHEPLGFLDVQLAVSHNGRHWERPSEGAWIPLTPLPDDFERKKSSRSPETGVDPFDSRVPWDYANNSASMLGPLRVGDELWMYYSGRSTDHRSRPHVGAIGLGTLRLDGFFSLDAGANTGTLTTKPLQLANDTLRVNANAAGGELRLAIFDESGSPIEPFTFENCDPVTTDSVRHRITWSGVADLSSLSDRTVHLQFQLTDAELYAFWTGDERQWTTPETSTWLFDTVSE
ncbi:MAG: hypothetical protein KDA86_17900 [Planctomycetaceae bacterium]|nr:hypothetical protein [Planctomycetaceae bacterium]